MFGHRITPSKVRTPVAARTLGLMKFFELILNRPCPDWCERRYVEAWTFRPRTNISAE